MYKLIRMLFKKYNKIGNDFFFFLIFREKKKMVLTKKHVAIFIFGKKEKTSDENENFERLKNIHRKEKKKVFLTSQLKKKKF
jgi:hypothetical protein